MNVLPIVRRRVSWMDAERFNGIDGLEDFFDLGPAGEAQERFSARTHTRDRRITFAWSHRSQNVDARKGRAPPAPCHSHWKQRTNANMLPGMNGTTRRLRSRIVS